MTSPDITISYKTATETISFVITMLAGLETSVRDLTDRDTLNVYAITSSYEEPRFPEMTEEMLHLLPNLKRFEMMIFDPEFSSSLSEETARAVSEPGCCPDCIQLGKTSRLYLSNRPCHKLTLATIASEISAADLIVAFNARQTFNTWIATLERILNMDTPAVFTSPCRESALKDARRLRKLDANFMLSPRKNKWASLLPQPLVMGERLDGCFKNDWWFIVKGRK